VSQVEALENEVKKLSRRDLAAFRDWFSEFDAIEWDAQIEADLKAGRLDGLAAKAVLAHERGESRDL
jgi:hypothetical protein